MPDLRRSEVDRQLSKLFARSRAFAAMPLEEQSRILADTGAIVQTMAENKVAQAKPNIDRAHADDPFAVDRGSLARPLEGGAAPLQPGLPPPLPGSGSGGQTASTPTFTGGAQPGATSFGPKAAGEFGTAIATGTSQAGEMLRQVNFPAFVAELVQGVFQAVVDASIQQLRAYAELVRSVTMSLNEFRDANVTENQGRDHLVSKFPQLMQISVSDAGPKVGLREGVDEEELAKVSSSLGLDEPVTDLTDEEAESRLVDAARNDLARSRQSMLATMLLMGINRIVVTDGKINAKLRFNFTARDTYQQHATKYDYKDFGTTRIQQSTHEESSDTGESYKENRFHGYSPQGGGYAVGGRSGESHRWSTGSDQTTEMPSIYLTNTTDTVTGGELTASAALSGDVTLGFKSETFDLNKLASADEVFRLERIRSAGRAAPGAPLGSPQAGGQPSATEKQATTPATTPPG
jgi:hypothetical protein